MTDKINWPNASSDDLQRLKIIRILFKDVPHLTLQLFVADKPEMHGGLKAMLAIMAGWSSGERALARLALEIWFNENLAIDLGYVVRTLDESNFNNFLDALRMWRDL